VAVFYWFQIVITIYFSIYYNLERKMCNASSNVQVEELRIGLFRVHWDLEKNMRKECGFFKNKLHLHGSQSGRIYNIIYIFESKHFDGLYPLRYSTRRDIVHL
jgi:hypothetical protein